MHDGRTVTRIAPNVPGSKHPIRFVGALGHEVVYQHPNVALVAADRELGHADRLQARVRP